LEAFVSLVAEIKQCAVFKSYPCCICVIHASM
jgi:hypothetical protein